MTSSTSARESLTAEGSESASGSPVAKPPTASDGIVLGAPRLWLRVEGATLLAGALVAFSTTHEAWWLVPLIVLAPDFLAVGYLGGTRVGARCYNVAHATPLPAIMVGLGWWRGLPVVLALGLIWLAHIGVDRLLGYGLKYNDNFQHTHLGWSGGASEDGAIVTSRT
jgi:Domain of unknown function (DUF4260)